MICTKTTPTYFDKNKPVFLHVDSSIKGLDASLDLFQNNKPIAFASNALTPAETRYANIGLDLLAVVYCCQKFHSYLFGRTFAVRTPPLKANPLKELDASSPTSSDNVVSSTTLRRRRQIFSMKEMVTADASVR